MFPVAGSYEGTFAAAIEGVIFPLPPVEIPIQFVSLLRNICKLGTTSAVTTAPDPAPPPAPTLTVNVSSVASRILILFP